MRAAVPYYSQFASRDRVNLFLAEPDSTSSDPRWAESGWLSPQDYADWAWRTCGVACLRSILGAHGHCASAAALTRDLLEAGAYTSHASNESVGLIYQPFVRYLHTRWNLPAHVLTGMTITDLARHLSIPGRVVIVSVSPTIRNLPADPTPSPRPRPGGHLVLTLNADHEHVWFHNPSGYWPHRQENVALSAETFAHTFAGRGVAVDLPTPERGHRRRTP